MTDVEMRQCWKCGEQTPADDPYCQHCGTEESFSEAMSALDRTDREGASERNHRLLMERFGSHTAAGIILIATILVVVFWFWIAILVMAVFWKPEPNMLGLVTFLDYLDAERLLYGATAAVGLLVASWAVAYKIAEAE